VIGNAVQILRMRREKFPRRAKPKARDFYARCRVAQGVAAQVQKPVSLELSPSHLLGEETDPMPLVGLEPNPSKLPGIH
jgi:hypothetical protein